MRLDNLIGVLNGLGLLVAVVTAASLDTGLLPEISGYWRRFSFIGTRYGLPGFLVWLIIVFLAT